MKYWFTVFSMVLGLASCYNYAVETSCDKRFCGDHKWLLFGNSFFDTGAGNVLATQLGVPQPNPQPPFSNGRHSNGPIWVDYAADLLDAKVKSFAVSGSTTGAVNVTVPQLGGIFQQIARFKEKHCCIHPGTLVIMDGGGNDILSVIPNNINPPAVQAAIQQALGNQAFNFSQLQALGAKQIVVWNLGNLAMLPLFTDPAFGLQAAIPLFEAATAGFNAGLLQIVQAFNRLAHDHQQIYIFPAFDFFNEVAAELQRRGINLTQHTLTSVGLNFIVTGPPPDNLAFYDQVHPTTLAWQVFADFAADYIDTLKDGPRFIAIEQDLAFASAAAHRDAVNNHYRTIHLQRFNCCCTNDYGCGNCFVTYVDGLAKWGNIHTRCGTLGSRYDTQLGLLGADFNLSDCITVGSSFTYQHSFARAKEHRGHFKLVDYIPTVYATLYGCNAFVDADFSYHFYHFDSIKRKLRFLNKEAKGHCCARGLEGNIQFGYIADCNCLTLIPIAGLGVEGLHIDNYHEKGRNIKLFELNVKRQHQNSFYGKLGAQFFWNSCDCCYSPFGEIMYEHEFHRTHGQLVTRFKNSEDGARIYHRTSPATRDLLKFTVGVDARFSQYVVGNISYQGETTFNEYSNGVKAQLDFYF